MGLSPRIHDLSGPDEARLGDSGFATPAAVVISLAVATVAIAVQSRAILELHATERDYARTAAEVRLDGVQRLALADLYGGGGLARPEDQIGLDGRAYTVQAEPDATKLPLSEASGFSPQTLKALGASQASAVARNLARLAADPAADDADLAELDPSPRWKRCALSAISTSGGTLTSGASPLATRAAAQVGEVWRVVATGPDGWTEDRTLRVTGEEHTPARTIGRRLYRLSSGANPCPSMAVRPPAERRRMATP